MSFTVFSLMFGDEFKLNIVWIGVNSIKFSTCSSTSDPLCPSVGMDENIGIPKVSNTTSKGNHPGVSEGGSQQQQQQHHHHHPLHYHHHPHGSCGSAGPGGGGAQAGSCLGSNCKGGHHHHHQQWGQGMEMADGGHHHVSKS